MWTDIRSDPSASIWCRHACWEDASGKAGKDWVRANDGKSSSSRWRSNWWSSGVYVNLSFRSSVKVIVNRPPIIIIRSGVYLLRNCSRDAQRKTEEGPLKSTTQSTDCRDEIKSEIRSTHRKKSQSSSTLYFIFRGCIPVPSFQFIIIIIIMYSIWLRATFPWKLDDQRRD